MHVDVGIAKSDGQIFNGCLFHLGRRERAQLTFGVRSPFPNDFTVVNCLVRPPGIIQMLLLLI